MSDYGLCTEVHQQVWHRSNHVLDCPPLPRNRIYDFFIAKLPNGNAWPTSSPAKCLDSLIHLDKSHIVIRNCWRTLPTRYPLSACPISHATSRPWISLESWIFPRRCSTLLFSRPWNRAFHLYRPLPGQSDTLHSFQSCVSCGVDHGQEASNISAATDPHSSPARILF